jgi:RimJ/RimL family protein N-acetyltransferase
MPVKIQGKKVFLRKIDPATDNLDIYLGWLRDTDTNQFILGARQDYSRKELVGYVNQKNFAPDTFFVGIFTNDAQRFIGTIKLEPINFKEKYTWLGMLIGDKSDHGKGFGFEALGLILKFANDELALKKVYLGVDPNNVAARNLYLKSGFKFDTTKLNVMDLDLDLKFKSIF